ncbi:unnamed protein product [Caenorhabditis angaria]|uniref:galactosylgalactosylxylosylprotein 3-beta-glucuronosyltransferase n=1 Tax=Caenorhabditis angaria TaxID=860376 RepID=A0A9P1IB07_9PELO|nr:unnamed protein product [Caenorhabditis angaria]
MKDIKIREGKTNKSSLYILPNKVRNEIDGNMVIKCKYNTLAMLDSRFFEKWWFRAFLALMIFFIWQLFYSISKVQSLDEERATLQATIEVLHRKSDGLRLEILEKERTLTRLNSRVSEVDTLIRDHISLVPKNRKSEPTIFFITPTSFRAAQKADLTRLSYTLSHVPNLHWIVIEDSDEKIGKY